MKLEYESKPDHPHRSEQDRFWIAVIVTCLALLTFAAYWFYGMMND